MEETTCIKHQSCLEVTNTKIPSAKTQRIANDSKKSQTHIKQL